MNFGALENNELTIAAGKYMEECFNKGDCEAVFREDVLPFIWKKVIVNCTVSTVCAVTRLKIGYVENNPYGKKLFHEDKLCVVLYALGHSESLPRVAARFNIPSHNTVKNWIKGYRKSGNEARCV